MNYNITSNQCLQWWQLHTVQFCCTLTIITYFQIFTWKRVTGQQEHRVSVKDAFSSCLCLSAPEECSYHWYIQRQRLFGCNQLFFGKKCVVVYTSDSVHLWYFYWPCAERLCRCQDKQNKSFLVLFTSHWMLFVLRCGIDISESDYLQAKQLLVFRKKDLMLSLFSWLSSRKITQL